MNTPVRWADEEVIIKAASYCRASDECITIKNELIHESYSSLVKSTLSKVNFYLFIFLFIFFCW